MIVWRNYYFMDHRQNLFCLLKFIRNLGCIGILSKYVIAISN